MFDDLPIRKIIHVDMDAFYAAVEQMDRPELKRFPIAVGGSMLKIMELKFYPLVFLQNQVKLLFGEVPWLPRLSIK